MIEIFIEAGTIAGIVDVTSTEVIPLPVNADLISRAAEVMPWIKDVLPVIQDEVFNSVEVKFETGVTMSGTADVSCVTDWNTVQAGLFQRQHKQIGEKWKKLL